MAFRVEIAPQAFEDLDAIAAYIRKKGSPAAATNWFTGIMNDIASLAEMPSRHPIAGESDDVGQEVRVLLSGRSRRTFKIYFSIDHETRSSGTVRVFHVRHWARKPLDDSEISDLAEER